MSPRAAVESLLREAMGLDARSIGSSAIERAIFQRVSACDLEDGQAYWTHLRNSNTELQELIESVVVSETWFFRDRQAFTEMTRTVTDEWLPRHFDGVLRILSLPSSTGEEPYSIAMALLDAGVPANRFRIDAIDISARALARAQHAIYGKNSFRGSDLDFMDRHFEKTDVGYKLSERVRNPVTFQQGNLFAAGFLPGSEIYDVIFCRNLLIYFDRDTQGSAIGVLTRLLTASGSLFVAPSETGILMNHGFVSTKVPLAFAFRKETAVERPPKRKATAAAPAPDAPVIREQRAAPMPARNVQLRQDAPAVPQSAPAPAPAASRNVLGEAEGLANQRRFADAIDLCTQHMRDHGPSAAAFYLLGVVHDAGGNRSEAATCYRKALYLEPAHHEALIHLALLLEQQGRKSDAQVLRARARRLDVKGTV